MVPCFFQDCGGVSCVADHHVYMPGSFCALLYVSDPEKGFSYLFVFPSDDIHHFPKVFYCPRHVRRSFVRAICEGCEYVSGIKILEQFHLCLFLFVPGIYFLHVLFGRLFPLCPFLSRCSISAIMILFHIQDILSMEVPCFPLHSHVLSP